MKKIPTIPGEFFAKFQTSLYADQTDAVFKALGDGNRDAISIDSTRREVAPRDLAPFPE